MNISIGKKFAIGILSILLFSFLFAGGVGVYLFNNMIQDNLQQTVVQDLNAADVLYQDHLMQIEDTIYYTASSQRICIPLIDNDSDLLYNNLVNIYNERFKYKLDFITVTDKNGVVIVRAANYTVSRDSMYDHNLIRSALNGTTVSSTQIMTEKELLKERKLFTNRSSMGFNNTPKVKPEPDNISTTGMVIMAAAPIKDNEDNIIGVLYGGDLINQDNKIVDKIQNALYPNENNDNSDDIGVVTIYQDDFRISTTVPIDTKEQPVSTRVLEEVHDAVLNKGKYWEGRAFVVDEWYVTAYKPIKDFDGNNIGMIKVGILEHPYIDKGYKVLGIYLVYLFSGFILSIFLTRYFTKTITKPLYKLTRGTKDLAHGNFKKINIKTNDEIEKLADAFNDMAIELQKTMGKLISSRNEIVTMFESMSDVASAQDMNMKITFANKLAKEIYGEDIIGKFCYKVYAYEEDYCENCPALDSIKTTTVSRVVHTRLNKNKLPCYCEIICSALINEKNDISGTLIIRRDVTESKTLEYELKQSFNDLESAYKELQQIDTKKSEIVTNFSHEIRTPLTAIKGFSELMIDDTFGITTEKQKKYLAIIIQNTDRLTKLITDVLDLSKLDSKNLNISTIKLNDLMNIIKTDFTKSAVDKQIEISVEMEDKLVLEADKDKIASVFTNLLENAIKFTDSGGKISIKAYHKDKDHVHIEISDTGIGMPDDELERIFDRFYQVDASSTRKFGGTGLGLALTKITITKHDGKIWAHSVVGEGSSFHIILPVKQSTNINTL